MSLCHPVHFSSRLSACVRVCVCVRERGKEGGREQRHVCWRKKVFFGGTNCLHTRCLSYRMANSILGISSSEEYVLQKNILQKNLSICLNYRVVNTHGSHELQIIFQKRATKYRSLLRKMTYKDKGSYESLPPCTLLFKAECVRACMCVRERER